MIWLAVVVFAFIIGAAWWLVREDDGRGTGHEDNNFD